jgi:hypothetical protein
LPPDYGRVGEDGLFEIFWKAYPRKEAPKVAKIAFEKLKPDKNLLSVMLNPEFPAFFSPRGTWRA